MRRSITIRPKLCALLCLALFYPTAAFGHGVDGEPHPKVRTQNTPIIPPNANVSGYCCLLIDVNIRGDVENVRTTFCSEDYYDMPSKVAVSTWTYEPFQDKKGKVTRFNDHKVKSHFIMQGLWGQRLANARGYGARVSGETNYDSPCSDYVA